MFSYLSFEDQKVRFSHLLRAHNGPAKIQGQLHVQGEVNTVQGKNRGESWPAVSLA